MSEIHITIHGDSVTIIEDGEEEVTFPICDDSLESAINDIGEAVKDYLEGLTPEETEGV